MNGLINDCRVGVSYMLYIGGQTAGLHSLTLTPSLAATLRRISLVAQPVDVDSMGLLYMEHQVPGVVEHLRTLDALQVDLLALRCLFLKA